MSRPVLAEPPTHRTRAAICQHPTTSVHLRTREAVIHRCADCSRLFTPKLLERFDATALSDDFYRNEIGVGASRFGPWVESIVRMFRAFRALKVYTLDRAARSILDVGYGRGWTLHYLRKFFGFTRTAGPLVLHGFHAGADARAS